jgi:hypothetical protein
MKEIFDKAKNHQQLHPLADIDPFTNEPLDGTDFQSMLRQHATKCVLLPFSLYNFIHQSTL